MVILIAGIRSRAEGGRVVPLKEIYDQLHGPALELYTGTNRGTPPPDYFFHKGGMETLRATTPVSSARTMSA